MADSEIRLRTLSVENFQAGREDAGFSQENAMSREAELASTPLAYLPKSKNVPNIFWSVVVAALAITGLLWYYASNARGPSSHQQQLQHLLARLTAAERQCLRSVAVPPADFVMLPQQPGLESCLLSLEDAMHAYNASLEALHRLELVLHSVNMVASIIKDSAIVGGIDLFQVELPKAVVSVAHDSAEETPKLHDELASASADIVAASEQKVLNAQQQVMNLQERLQRLRRMETGGD
eukprot:jgi/Mesvir1/6199/Mv00883-RA.1